MAAAYSEEVRRPQSSGGAAGLQPQERRSLIYVLRMDESSVASKYLPTRVMLVGPFDSKDTAHRWATSKDNNPYDDPRWQSVWLPDTTIPVVAPREATIAFAEPADSE